MRFRPILILLALAALTLFVAGCGDDEETTTEPAATTTEGATGATGDGGGGGGAAASSVAMSEYEFDPADLTVAQGDSIEVTNDGDVPHNLTVESDDLATSDIDGGGSEDLTVDLEPGDYEFICTISNHADLGMTGTMTVE